MDRIIPVSEFRSNLSSMMRWVETQRRPVILTRNGHARFVLLDIETYDTLTEGRGNDGTRDAEPPRRPAGPVAGFKKL